MSSLLRDKTMLTNSALNTCHNTTLTTNAVGKATVQEHAQNKANDASQPVPSATTVGISGTFRRPPPLLSAMGITNPSFGSLAGTKSVLNRATVRGEETVPVDEAVPHQRVTSPPSRTLSPTIRHNPYAFSPTSYDRSSRSPRATSPTPDNNNSSNNQSVVPPRTSTSSPFVGPAEGALPLASRSNTSTSNYYTMPTCGEKGSPPLFSHQIVSPGENDDDHAVSDVQTDVNDSNTWNYGATLHTYTSSNYRRDSSTFQTCTTTSRSVLAVAAVMLRFGITAYMASNRVEMQQSLRQQLSLRTSKRIPYR